MTVTVLGGRPDESPRRVLTVAKLTVTPRTAQDRCAEPTTPPTAL
jgi:hypothetical protein